jgi:hypothetical protein
MPQDWKQQLTLTTKASELIELLQEIAAQENISGVTRQCLELLAHDDSEVRVWAAEALESAAQPGAAETQPLTEWLEKLIEQQATAARKAFVWPSASQPTQAKQNKPNEQLATSLLADQLYWTATMIGRIGAEAATADPILARLEELKNHPGAADFHAAAARAERVRRNFSA